MKVSSEKGVTHWVDGRATWKLGMLGFLLRLRGFVVSSILLGLPLAGVPFWWPENIPEKIEVHTLSLVIHCLIALIAVLVGSFFYLRQRVQRSLNLKAELHVLEHDSRDALSDLLRRNKPTAGRKLKNGGQYERKYLIDFSNKACETIARYFSTLLRDNTIGCAIRIGVAEPAQKTSEIEYITVGRSGVLNRGRDATSQPVPRSTGIPKFFLSDDVACKGILFYDDLEKAAANGAYMKTRNDNMYKGDIKTMVVAPINGWNGVRPDLIGLLYITSQTDRVLNPKHVDLMKFTADHLALVYSSMFAKLHSNGSMPQLAGVSDDDYSK